MAGPAARRIVRLLPLALACLPPLYLAVAVWQLAVDVPFYDHWDFAQLLDRSFEGLSLRDLWQQHNEHRPMFALLVVLPLARLSGWNTNLELVGSLIAAAASFGLLVRRMATAGLIRDSRGWAVPALSLLVFSMAQQENWLWGWQIQIPLNLLAVVGGIFLLTAPARGRAHILGAALLGVVAVYTFSNGSAYWIAGALALALHPHRSGRTSRALVFWGAAAILTSATFFYHWEIPPYDPSMASFRNPVPFVLYLLRYIGAPLAGFSLPLAALCGLAGLAAQGLLLRRLGRDDLGRVLPFLALGLYALLSAGITAVGRAGAGSEQALASRYVTFAQLLWISVGACALPWLANRPRSRNGGPVPSRAVAWLLLASIGAGGIATTVHGTERAIARSRYLALCRTLLVNYRHLDSREQAQLSTLYPVPGVVLYLAPMLERRRLSVFRDLPDDRSGEPEPRGR